MAFLLSSFARSVAANSSSALSQTLALDKHTSKQVVSFIKSGVGKHWRKVAVVGTCGALIAGAYKVHCDLVAWREQQDLALSGNELSLLSSLHSVQNTSSEVVGATLEAIGCTPLVEDETELEDVLDIDVPKSSFMATGDLFPVPGETDEEASNRIQKNNRRERKKIRTDKFGVALKSLVAKAKLAFPVPKNTELHIQAVNLFLYKECRKINLRISDAAILIPQAVALAIVPSDEQILAGQLAGIPSIQRRYLQRNWNGKEAPLHVRVVNSIRSFVSK